MCYSSILFLWSSPQNLSTRSGTPLTMLVVQIYFFALIAALIVPPLSSSQVSGKCILLGNHNLSNDSQARLFLIKSLRKRSDYPREVIISSKLQCEYSKHAKIDDKNRRFGVFMTPLSLSLIFACLCITKSLLMSIRKEGLFEGQRYIIRINQKFSTVNLE